VTATSAICPRCAVTTRSTGLGLRGQRAQRPLTVTGEEAEVAGRRGRHLGGELTRAVEQTDVRRLGTGTTAAQDLALNDGFLGWC
jgi:hypothetical protein